jgi:L-ornithine Nalpha-acyltransferase
VQVNLKPTELRISLAQTELEIEAAQRLRYRVFHEEMGAKPGGINELDADIYDDFCDHLKVTTRNTDELVGTYRLLRQEVAAQNIGFYSQTEFNIEPLLRRKESLSFLELGRSCILKPYRGKAVLELLWQGIWDYACANRVDVMLGCASFAGTNIYDHAEALSFLAHHASAPADWQVRAHDACYQEMRLIPKHQIEMRRALSSLPTLIKAYLRLGCFIGEGAVIDREFNTIDVLIVLPVANINQKYFKHYGAPKSSFVSTSNSQPIHIERPNYSA